MPCSKGWCNCGQLRSRSRRAHFPAQGSKFFVLGDAAGQRLGAVRPKGEESGTTPGRAGDRAGDGRETGVGRALPLKSIGCDGDGVALTVIVANEHRAGFEPAPGRAAVARQAVLRTLGFPDQGRQRPAPAGAKRSFAPAGPCSEAQAAFVRTPLASVAEGHQAQVSAGERSQPRSRPPLSAAAA